MRHHKKLLILTGSVAAVIIIILLIFVPIDDRTEYVCTEQVKPGVTHVDYTYHWFSDNGVNAWDNKLSETSPGRPGCDIPAHIKLYFL